MLYRVQTANRLLTYREAIDFLFYCHDIKERDAHKYMTESNT